MVVMDLFLQAHHNHSDTSDTLVRLKPSLDLVIKIAIANTCALYLLTNLFKHLLDAVDISVPLGHQVGKLSCRRTLPHLLKLADILANLRDEVRKLDGLSCKLTSSLLHRLGVCSDVWHS